MLQSVASLPGGSQDLGGNGDPGETKMIFANGANWTRRKKSQEDPHRGGQASSIVDRFFKAQ